MSEPCGCDPEANPLTPLPIANRPGLDALAYRVGTYATFFAAMKARLADPKLAALKALRTREVEDPAIALIDAWAVVADVLTFYQERIANEGYLKTATERRSVVELARLVGSSLRPGVSASTCLAYSLEQNSTATIPTGSRAQSMPVQGQLPQAFETAEDMPARGEWNNLAPRLTRPQIVEPGKPTIYVAGITSNLKPNDPVLIVTSPPKLRRLAAVEVQAQQNRTKVTLQYVSPPPAPQPIAAGLTPLPVASDPARFAAAETPLSSIVTLATALAKLPAETGAEKLLPGVMNLRPDEAPIPTPVTDAVPGVLKTFLPEVGPQLYTAWKNATTVAAPLTGEFHALRIQAAPFGHNAPLRPITNKRGVVTGTEEWPLDVVTISITVSAQSESDAESRAVSVAHMQALLRGEKPTAVVKIARGSRRASAEIDLSDTVSSTPVGSWTMESQFTRHNHRIEFHCPELQRRFDIVLDERRARDEVKIDQETPIGVAEGQTVSSSAIGRRTTISNVDGISILDESAIAPERLDVIELDSVYEQIVPGGWVAIIRPDRGEPIAAKVTEVQNVSMARYGMSGRVTQLTLARDWLDPKKDLLLSAVRNVTVAAQSEQLSLAEEPIEEGVAGKEIELGDLYGEIPSGRQLIVTGERIDVGETSGVTGTELVRLARVEHRVQVDRPPFARPGERTHSFLKLTSELAYTYKRDTVTIYGNVVRATHGETRTEVLGSGDGSRAMQAFTLRQAPLTHVPASTRAGMASTLEVRVNDILWHEIATLADAGASDRCYVTHTDDGGKTTITFGDGVHGMRLPTGRENVIAVYRTGTGSVGNVPANAVSQLGSRPFGVKAVIGPLAATGGVDREGREEGKSNVPLAASALDRLVSVQDHAAFARTFAGIGKACAVELSNGVQPVVYVTVAGADGALIDRNSDHFQNLLQAFRQFGDPHLPVQLDACELMLLVIGARVRVLPDYQWNTVEPRIRSALTDVFGFPRRDLGQSVALSEVISAIQRVSGVAYVDVDILDSVSREDAENPDEAQKKLKAIEESTKPRERICARLVGKDPVTNAPLPAQLAFLSPDVPETLMLKEIGS
jgi:predicted phage baseplate assembly protein